MRVFWGAESDFEVQNDERQAPDLKIQEVRKF